MTTHSLDELSLLVTETADRVFKIAEPVDDERLAAALWSDLAQAGLPKLLTPEIHGGAGDAFMAAAALANRVGAHAAHAPLIETLVANWIRGQAGLAIDDDPCSVVFCHLTGASLNDAAGLIISRPLVVPWFPYAASALFVDTGHIAVLEHFLSGASGFNLAGEKSTSMRQKDVPRHMVVLKTCSDVARTAFELYALLKASAMAGAMETLLSMCIEYANTRTQFGRPIGKFQAIQHNIATISSDAVMTATSVQQAAIAFGGPRQSWYVALAKATASAVAGDIAKTAHQIHGAMGFTEEFPLHRFTRRLWTWRDEAGSESFWRSKIGAACLDHEGHRLWECITDGASL